MFVLGNYLVGQVFFDRIGCWVFEWLIGRGVVVVVYFSHDEDGFLVVVKWMD